MEQEHKPSKKKKRGIGFKITLGIILLLILGAGVYGFTVYDSIANTFNKTHKPLNRTNSKDRVVNLAEKDPFSILLLGIDQRDGDRGRPDSLMLLTVNPDDQSVKMVSIPRDTYTEIPGKGTKDKINHAYSYGGVDISIKAIENLLQIPIDYYVSVDMNGFKDIVDAVGGISVNNTLDFTYGGVHYPVGQLQLNGEEALKYARMRHLDPEGDFGRQQRQRKIIQAVIKEGASVKTLANYGSILDAIGNNVRTNLTFDEIKSIHANYKNALHNFDQIQISGNGKEMDGEYYYFIPEEELAELSKTLKKHLNMG
ncbi:LytR family transcriptional regulator [Bacillus sp. FJAT-49705]|uniref:Polyisoprenyl-teichoic acid--peptidoglycan teichoic acid transferase TagU n=1 Tax=Cytobacillus citreus TaxID=2833586 RepID=A0ABS5P0B7_9BACI|nr:LytR family transcriptional regulator [Cytobacillus citreus]MBS4192604.1 LytR family transcriptional regulator [Cytobacillus citreus]